MKRTVAVTLALTVFGAFVCLALSAAGVARVGAPAQAVQPRRERPVRYAPFEVEVLVDGYPLEQYPAGGRLYVEARRGAEYALRVRNPLPVRVAVALSVDGLNSIDARHTAARDASKWVIQPYSTITISGWQMSSTRARRFYFTGERDSYAGRMGRADDIGVIAAVFFREREDYREITPPEPYPLGVPRPRADREEKRQPSTSAQSARTESGAGRDSAAAPDDEYAATGIGRSVGNDVRWVRIDLEREPAAEVTLRYEYRDALVRLGVLPRPQPVRPDPLRRRERARGFEDPRFSPEPPERE